MKNDDTYHVGDTIFVSLYEVCKADVIIKEVAPNMVNLFTKPTKACPKSKLFLKAMKAIKIQKSRTINKSTLWRHIKAGWCKSKEPFDDWICIWRVKA